MGIRTFLKNAGLTLCLGLGYLFKPQGIPVLVYHSIDDSNSYVSIYSDMFVMQMSYLKGEGFQLISLGQLMATVRSKQHIPEKTIVLTFDDGLQNFYTAAWPVLARYGFSATLFVPTDYIGKQSWWYVDYGLKPVSMLDWPQLRELSANNVDIQSHGCSHCKLTEIAPPDFQRELEKSKHVLEDGLGRPVDFFCYPFGEVTQNIAAAAGAAGYRGAACMDQGLYNPGDDPYLIKRESLDYISIPDKRTALLSIATCAQGTFAWYVRTKRRLKGYG
ncbi:MAG: polysaccharide deacetylase family protein [Thermodesulfobacteriota bacterium]